MLFGLALGLIACPHPAPPRDARPGCSRDSDCKGERICSEGRCVDPVTAAQHPTPMPPAETPGRAAVTLEGPPPTPPVGGPSPMFMGGPQHSGRSPYHAPRREPRERWRFRSEGVIFGAPTLAEDGTVLFGSHDHHVYALTAAGALRWRFKTGDLVWGAPALGGGGVAYVGSDDDHLYALGLGDGAVRFDVTPGQCRRAVGIGPEASRCDIDQVTVGPDGALYTGGDAIYALNPDGSLRWRFSPAQRTHCAGAPALGADGAVYLGCQDDSVYAINPDGTRRWEFRGGDDFDGSPSVGADGTVYIGGDDKRLYALGPDGRPKYSLLTEGPIRGTPAITANGTVYVGSYDGALYAVREGGVVSWVYRTADRIHGSALIDGSGVVVFGSQDDRLYALAPDGKLLWSHLLDGDVDSTPVLGPDGTLYIGADDRALHALR